MNNLETTHYFTTIRVHNYENYAKMQHLSEADVPGVTPRELSIIKDVAKGMSTKQIAAKYGVSVKVVEKHRSRIMKKTGCANMSEVVHRYTKAGIIA